MLIDGKMTVLLIMFVLTLLVTLVSTYLLLKLTKLVGPEAAEQRKRIMKIFVGFFIGFIIIFISLIVALIFI